MGAISTNHAIGDCCECEVLHLREALEGEDYELPPGYYVLREVILASRGACAIAFYDDGSIAHAPRDARITFGIVSQAGEDEDGRLVADGNTHILPGYALRAFAGIGLRAREAFMGDLAEKAISVMSQDIISGQEPDQ